MRSAERDVAADRVAGRALWLYSVLLVLTTALAWAVYAWNSFPQYIRPLFIKQDRFTDLTLYTGKMAHLLGGSERLGTGMPVYNYPASAAFVYKFLLYLVPAHPVGTYVVVLSVALLAMCALAFRSFSDGNEFAKVPKAAGICAILITAFAGYPIAFTVDRANIEGIVWALSAFGLCLMLRGRYSLAAVLIGIAAAIKPFPGLFILVLVARRRYKDAATSVTVAASMTLIALIAIGPNPVNAYRNLKHGIDGYLSRYVTNLPPPEEARFDHSILDRAKFAAVMVEMKGPHPFQLPREVLRLCYRPGGWRPAKLIAMTYPVVLVVSLGLLILVFRRKPILNQITAVAIAINILPLSAADYTLLHLYIPFGAWVVFLYREQMTRRRTIRSRTVFLVSAEYALLFSPLTFVGLYAADAKFLLMCALLFQIARTPMPSEFFGDLPLQATVDERSLWGSQPA